MTQPPDIDLSEDLSVSDDRKLVSTTDVKQEKMARLHAYAKREFADLRQFLAKPVRRFSGKSNGNERWARVAFLAALGLLINLIFVLTIGLALDSWTTLEIDRDMTGVAVIFAILVIAPLMEEIVFRAGLRNLQYSLFVGPVLITLFFGNWQIAAGIFLFSMSVAVYLYFLGSDSRKHQYAGERFLFSRQFIQHYPKVFWLYASAFAFVHVANFSFTDASGLLVVFAVIPQLSMGVLWGYVRLRDGLKSAITLHFLNNLLVALLMVASGT